MLTLIEFAVGIQPINTIPVINTSLIDALESIRAKPKTKNEIKKKL